MSQLDALVCPSCAAALPLAASTSAAGGLACRHCGAEVELPPEYVEAARTLARRVDARRQLEPLWSRLTSPPSWRWTIVAGRDRERLAHSLRTLEDAIARVRARRRLSLLGTALVLSPLLALGWALRWAYG